MIDKTLMYNYLITNNGFSNDFSLSAINNKETPDGIKLYDFNLNIQNDNEDFINTLGKKEFQIVSDKDAIGNLLYVNEAINPQKQIKKSVIGFSLTIEFDDERRDAAQKLMEDFYKTNISNYQYVEAENKHVMIMVQPPTFSDKYSRGNRIRFISVIPIFVSSYENISYKEDDHYYYVDRSGDDVEIIQRSSSKNRQINISENTVVNPDQIYVAEKSNETLSFSGLLLKDNNFFLDVMNVLEDPDKAIEMIFPIHHENKNFKIDNVKNYIITNVEMSSEELSPSEIQITFSRTNEERS